MLLKRRTKKAGPSRGRGTVGWRTQTPVTGDAPMTVNPVYTSIPVQTMDTTENPAYGLIEIFQQQSSVSNL